MNDFARAASVFVTFSDRGEAKSDRESRATRRRARTEELHAAIAIALDSGATVHVPTRVLPKPAARSC
jgi:hypothetical protein